MELNRDEVPVYGQVEVCAVLQDPQCVQEKAEYYVVLKGSHIHHVTTAQRKQESHLLSFIVPGHNVAEKVLVQLYCWEDSSSYIQPTLMSEELSLEYKWDTLQEVADLLLSYPENLTSSTHVDIQRKLCLEDSIQPSQNNSQLTGKHETSRLDEESLELGQRLNELNEDSGSHNPEENPDCWRHFHPDPGEGCKLEPCGPVDVKITQAVSNMHSFLQWNNQNPQKSQALRNIETPLHIAVRLGLYHLTLFYLQQSGGQEMATQPNEEGHVATELAQSRGHAATISALAHPEACKEENPVWMSQIWADELHLLRSCQLTSSSVLTIKHQIIFDPQMSIQLYREKHGYLGSHVQVDALTEVEEKSKQNQTDETSEAGLTSRTNIGDCVLLDSVFEEQLVLSVDEDEENHTPSNTEKLSSPSGSSSFQLQPTDITAARLTAMLNRTGKNDEQNRKLNNDLMTNGPSATVTPPAVKVEGTKEQRTFSHPFSPSLAHFSPISSPGLVLDRFLRSSCHNEHDNHNAGSPTESYEISPNLVALEMDSEEEEDDFLMRKPLPQISSETKDSGDKQDSFNPSSDLSCIRTHSASSDCNHSSQKDLDPGVRLRSYSYSSPKINLLSPRSSRDAPRPPADLSNEQRAASLTEQAQEKRELWFRRRTQSADDESSVELADSLQHLTLSEFLKEIEEEGWDKYIIPSKSEPEKYKVSRTFSFIKSRMYSTRSKKGKAKEKEVKEKQSNGHQFAAGPVLGTSACEVCDKPATGKETLHCSNCAVSIHKGCKDSTAQCLKKVQDKYTVSMMKARASTLPQNFVLRESTQSSQVSSSASLPMMSPRSRIDTAPLSRSVPLVPEWLAESPEGDNDSSSWRSHGQSEELLQTVESSTSTDSSLVEDAVDSPLQNSFPMDALYLEAESWSLAVESQFCQKQEKRTIKRQDVIYELMHTELHHLQTLTIMSEVFRRGMREEVGLDAEAIGRIFPCLDELLVLHRDFLSAMTERRSNSMQPDNEKNYLIHHVGDILVQQFSQENAENMKRVYGEFCSRHNEAVSFFKELQQQNKRFQLFIKQQSSNSLVKRREIPECILLVTQRITKYPVLLERILQYTEEGTQEHADISRALLLVRELISAVDVRVSEREQSQWLSDVLGRMESKSLVRLKSGAAFRKHDMTNGRTLLHHGPLLWKTATGRLKDVLALLLTDLLVFLQEKDQKYVFAAVDQKCPVISLQKLIVREVANEERGMFLISASYSGPEMYEVHAASKDERNAWMRLIREAVVICHEKEEDTASESEEERKAAEASQKIQKLQESLCGHDQLICSSLEEKLHIYAELAAMVGHRDLSPEPKLLVRPNTEELPNAAILLNAALKEAESLKEALSFPCNSTSCTGPLLAPEEQNASDSTVQLEAPPPTPSSLSVPAEEEPQAVDAVRSEDEESKGEDSLELQLCVQSCASDNHNRHLKVCQSVQSLTQLLYSLQALVTIQDSRYEVRRLLLLLLSSSAHQRISQGSLQEQERQREAERRRQELARAARERQRWARECQAQQLRSEERETELAQREQQCHEEVQRLQRQREELEEQQQEYQQSLERLREGQRSVEKEREKLEVQQRMMERWRHECQPSLPSTNIKLEGHQGTGDETKSFHRGLHGGLDEDGSIFVNEAAFLTPSMNNRHLHHYQHQQNQHNTHLLPGYENSPSAQNSLNSLLALSNHTHPTISTQDELWSEVVAPAIHTTRTAGAVGPGIYQGDAPSVPQAFVSMDTENQDPDGEEKIVYL